jgi:cell division septum initiation protein DivIVA
MGNLVSRKINCEEVCGLCEGKKTLDLEGELNKEFQKIGKKAKAKADELEKTVVEATGPLMKNAKAQAVEIKKKAKAQAGKLGEKAKEKAGEVLRASKDAGEFAGRLGKGLAFAILPGGGGGADGQHNVLASILGLTVVFASSLLQ